MSYGAATSQKLCDRSKQRLDNRGQADVEPDSEFTGTGAGDGRVEGSKQRLVKLDRKQSIQIILPSRLAGRVGWFWGATPTVNIGRGGGAVETVY